MADKKPLQGDGFQFARIEFYSAQGASKRELKERNGMKHMERGWSARDIASEAMRLQGHCDHVDNPQKPKLLHGVDPMQAAIQAERWGLNALDSKGRKLRSDSPILAGGVISLPRDRMKDWQAFRDAAIEDLKKKHGARLVSVVEHLDERHPHIHYYLVPLDTDPAFDRCHDGYAARQAARRSGKKAGAVMVEYKKAMIAWQDQFNADVASHFGLARIGPKRARLNREIALKAIQEKELKEGLETVEHMRYALDLEKEQIERKAADVAQAEQGLSVRMGEVESKVQSVSLAAAAAAALAVSATTKKAQAERQAADAQTAKAAADALIEKARKMRQQSAEELATAKTVGGKIGGFFESVTGADKDAEIKKLSSELSKSISETKRLSSFESAAASEKQRADAAETKLIAVTKDRDGWQEAYTREKKMRAPYQIIPVDEIAEALSMKYEQKTKSWIAADGEKFSIDADSGLWRSWTTGRGGKGAVSLVQHVIGCTFGRAMSWIRAEFGTEKTAAAMSEKEIETIQKNLKEAAAITPQPLLMPENTEHNWPVVRDGNPPGIRGGQKWSQAAMANRCFGVKPPKAMFGRS